MPGPEAHRWGAVRQRLARRLAATIGSGAEEVASMPREEFRRRRAALSN
jgi:hypothetical protein